MNYQEFITYASGVRCLGKTDHAHLDGYRPGYWFIDESTPCENYIKKEKTTMDRYVKQVIFLAPGFKYAETVRKNLASDLDRAGIPHHENKAGRAILIRTDKVNVEFVFTDPVNWTRDMFQGHDKIFGKRALIETLNETLNFNIHPSSSLSKYIRDLHSDAAPKEDTKPRTSYLPEITNAYFNNPVTVVMWDDGTKTIVKCQDGDVYSEETGLSLCITKKALGNMGNFNNVFRKWIPSKVDDDVFEEVTNNA